MSNGRCRVDTLTAVMFVVVNTVSCLVHVYSIGYMHHDPHRPRFFAYLSLFTFAMLMLVTSDNLLQMFFGWEGVGLASYLLIGFWYKKPSATAAAMKAFIVNRVGDFGFALGIFGVFVLFGSINFETIFAAAATYLPAAEAHGAAAEGAHVAGETVLNLFGMHLDKAGAITGVCLLLFMGAMGKSAQFLLHTWLPDAMEGPTPVSALIHAATMVTAGVFLVARMSPLFELSQTALDRCHADRRDHRLLCGDRRPGAERHQARHRLFDLLAARLHVRGARRRCLWRGDLPPVHACLLQGAAVPLRRLGYPCRRWRAGHAQHGWPAYAYPKLTFCMMMIGTLAITGVGIPGHWAWFCRLLLQGHRSSRRPMPRIRPVAGFAFTLLVIAACFTSFYSWRLIFMTFFGKPRASPRSHAPRP